jgi:hypothetical protein
MKPNNLNMTMRYRYIFLSGFRYDSLHDSRQQHKITETANSRELCKSHDYLAYCGVPPEKPE